ncbi:MAG: hydroxysqualene dehydroxylase HpnE [Pseudomonadota bacterium]
MATAHVVGGGVAGLSAAVHLAQAGWPVSLYESAGQAGGRCRSYHDDQLDRRIDNGNHLLLSGNRSARRYLDIVGASDELLIADAAAFPFVDLTDDTRWTVRIGPGRIPFWMLSKANRVPGTVLKDYLDAMRLRRPGARTVGALFDQNRQMYRRFWDPLTVAVLNTETDAAAAELLWPVFQETILKGAEASRPCIARRGLSESFVDPAWAWLERRNSALRLNTRLREIVVGPRNVDQLVFANETVSLGPKDHVVLAVPPNVAANLLPGLKPPDSFRPIVNAHFVTPDMPRLPQGAFLMGLVGSMAQWIFQRGDIISVTVSAGVEAQDMSQSRVLDQLWRDVCAALKTPHRPMPQARLITEKRATFAQTPEMLARRSTTTTEFGNLFLAGDWTATGLPATIEGAIRSGESAAASIGRAPDT